MTTFSNDPNEIEMGFPLTAPHSYVNSVELFQESNSRAVKLVRLSKADGPNETLQIAFGLCFLYKVSKAIFGNFWHAFSNKLGEHAADRLIKRFGWGEKEKQGINHENELAINVDEFLIRFELVHAQNVKQGYTTVLVLPSEFINSWRNAGLQLPEKDLTAEEMGITLVMLTLFKTSLEKLIKERNLVSVSPEEQNDDLSGKISLGDDGSISSVLLTKAEHASSQSRVLLRIDQDGQKQIIDIPEP